MILAVERFPESPTPTLLPQRRTTLRDRARNSLPAIVVKPEIEEGGPGSGSDHWIVTVYDNDYNGVDQVILILMKATGCPQEEAEIETWEIHNLGRSVVHHGGEKECNEAADIIRQIGIRVEVSEE